MRSLILGSWRRTSLRFKYVRSFANNRFAHKERYVSIEKQPQRLARWAVTVGDSLNEEIAVKDDAGSKFGHRLFVSASLLADGLLGLRYEVVEFFFCHPTFIEASRDRLDDLLKRFLSENRRFKQFQSGGLRRGSLALRRLCNGVDCIRIGYFYNT